MTFFSAVRATAGVLAICFQVVVGQELTQEELAIEISKVESSTWQKLNALVDSKLRVAHVERTVAYTESTTIGNVILQQQLDLSARKSHSRAITYSPIENAMKTPRANMKRQPTHLTRL